MDYIGRNAPLEFAERTKKNLEYIRVARIAGDDVHEVTQLMNSLLGLIVFIREERLIQSSGSYPVANYFEVSIGKTRYQTLPQLLRVLRNAIAHRNVEFSSDSRKWEDVAITFWNVPPKATDPGATDPGAIEPDWKATIEAMKLKDFCYELIDEIGS